MGLSALLNTSPSVSRRDFLKFGAGAALAATVGACSTDRGSVLSPTDDEMARLAEYVNTNYIPAVEEAVQGSGKTKLAGAGLEGVVDGISSWMLGDAKRESVSYSPQVGYDTPPTGYGRTLLASELRGDFDGNGKVNIFDLLEVLKVLGNKKPATPEYDLNNDGKVNIFDLLEHLKILAGNKPVRRKIDLQHYDNDTAQGARALIRATANGTSADYFTNDSGTASIYVDLDKEYSLSVQQIDSAGKASGYINRTYKIEAGRGDADKDVYSVSYPTTVTKEQFRDFIIEGNAGLNWHINFWDEGNMKYVLMEKSPYGDNYNMTSAQLDTVEAIIKEKVFTPLGIEVPIEKKGLDYDLPAGEERDGGIYVFGGQNFEVGTSIKNNAIKYAVVDIASLDERLIDPMITELSSGIFMPFEVSDNSIPRDKALMHGDSQLSGFQPADLKAYKTAQRFHGEHIDNVLGMN